MYEEKIIHPKKSMPQAVDGTLRKFALRVPERFGLPYRTMQL